MRGVFIPIYYYYIIIFLYKIECIKTGICFVKDNKPKIGIKLWRNRKML